MPWLDAAAGIQQIAQALLWQHFQGQHNRHAVNYVAAGLDAVDRSHTRWSQDLNWTAIRDNPSRLHQYGRVTEARGQRTVVQRDYHRALILRESLEVMQQ
jgi:hypothetical protein